MKALLLAATMAACASCAQAGTPAYFPMWNGRNVPQWAQDLGHVAAMRARDCQRWIIAPAPNPLGRMIHLPGCGEWAVRDSVAAVTLCDSLEHWNAKASTTISVSVDSLAELMALADSTTLHFHAPAFGSLDCTPDTSLHLRDAVRVVVLRLHGQAPSWYPGAERDSAAWARVRIEGEPDTVWTALTAPGAACSLRVARPGQYVPRVERQRCGSWRILVIP